MSQPVQISDLERPERALLVDIRKGRYKLHELEQLNNQLEVEALEASKASKLPEHVDREVISRLISQTYLDYWSQYK